VMAGLLAVGFVCNALIRPLSVEPHAGPVDP